MVQRMMREEEGYTLIEVLVAITIISIVLGIASTIFIFANQQLTRWSSDIEFYNNYHIAQSQVYKDVLRAEEVTFADSTITTKISDRDRIYTWSDGKLKLNNKVLLEGQIDSLLVTPINIGALNRQENGILKWSTTQVSNRRRLELQQVVALRNPVYWKQMDRK